MRGTALVAAFIGSLASAANAQPGAGEPAPLPPQAQPERTSAEAFQRYQRALEARKLSTGVPLSAARIQAELGLIEQKLFAGRRDEAIADLVYLVESPRFVPFEGSDGGRAAVFLLGDALGRAGAHDPAREYLRRALRRPSIDVWYRRSVDSLIDLGLESDTPEPFLKELAAVPSSAPPELAGDIAYLRGRIAERAGRTDEALAAYARVGEHSRFWAQATYLSGLIEVQRRNFRRGEQLFCRVADPKQTPKRAALFGRADFFRVRDLARLGLGRVAHEQYRFDDARYYYYLVPNDSERLPEALYETATTRYEAKDYAGARDAMDDLNRLSVPHPYQDEAFILDAYIDLAVCRFRQADDKLRAFLKRYEPARDASRRLVSDAVAMRRLVEAVRRGADPAQSGVGISEEAARALGMLLRLDAGYGRASRRLSELDHQLSGLDRAIGELDDAARRLNVRWEVLSRGEARMGHAAQEKLARIDGQIAELKRLIRDAERAPGSRKEELGKLARELQLLELTSRAARAERVGDPSTPVAGTADLAQVIYEDRALATRWRAEAAKVRAAVEGQQLASARSAFERLDRRLTRLLNRARLGRIETVLGKKRALEIEVEALSKGLLPRTIVDSLRTERYLEDDEEYWPFEGEDWEDEYVGGEGLR